MNTSTCLHLYPCDGKATGHLAASLPPLPEPVPPSRGSGTPAPGIQATSPHSVMQNQGGMPHQQQPDDPPWETMLLGTDQRRTVLHKRAAQDQADWVYTPYGHSQDTSGLSGGLGFNGEPRESTTGHYLLGAGYRAFNPVLMRFNNPDSLSPFEAGGLNPYAYCVGDPVNFIDPTGHLPTWAMMAIGIAGGIALGVVSGGVGTLVAGTMAASTAAAVGNAAMVIGVGLDVASLGTGVAGEVLGGKTGDLLGQVSLGLGLAGGVAGGFGGGMRLGAMSRAANGEVLPVSYSARVEEVTLHDNVVHNLTGSPPARRARATTQLDVIPILQFQNQHRRLSNTASIPDRLAFHPESLGVRPSQWDVVQHMNLRKKDLDLQFQMHSVYNPYANTDVVNFLGLIRSRSIGGG